MSYVSITSCASPPNDVRIDLKTGARKSIRPRGPPGGPPPRFNFIAPFVISPHDHRTLYLGGERVFRSVDRGDTWQPVSGDLTRGVPSASTGEGATISTVAESPITRGLLFVGTDDGNVQVSRDGGTSWTNVVGSISGLPATGNGRSRVWVSRVEPSHFEAGTVYVSFDAHRNDDFGAYVFATTDYGATWRSITGDLPRTTPVNVIREDLKNPDLLFAGTETGVFASLDRGRHWARLANGLPTVPVDDIVVHPRDSELVVGTHGRSVYVMDISPLQQLTRAVLTSEQHLFEPTVSPTFTVDVTRNKGASGARRYTGPNPYQNLVREDDSSGLSPPAATIWYISGFSSGTPQRDDPGFARRGNARAERLIDGWCESIGVGLAQIAAARTGRMAARRWQRRGTSRSDGGRGAPRTIRAAWHL